MKKKEEDLKALRFLWQIKPSQSLTFFILVVMKKTGDEKLFHFPRLLCAEEHLLHCWCHHRIKTANIMYSIVTKEASGWNKVMKTFHCGLMRKRTA